MGSYYVALIGMELAVLTNAQGRLCESEASLVYTANVAPVAADGLSTIIGVGC